jgi:hypothetical protein
MAGPLAGLTTTLTECSEDVSRGDGAPCASRRAVAVIASFVDAAPRRGAAEGAAPAPTKPAEGAGRPAADADVSQLPTADTPEAEAVRRAAQVLGCGSESCVLSHPALRKHAAQTAPGGTAAVDRDLATRFKAAGPRDSRALLSNYDIDATLRRWARAFPELWPCPFAMMDFDRNGDAFGDVDLADVVAGRAAVDIGAGAVRRPSPCFACVVNTDVSTGPGKHWVAVFADCRSASAWTVEYFNSAGRPPPRPMVGWMERARAQLAAAPGAPPVATVAVTDVDHQESQTECGLYALFYIRRRLEGTPYTFFAGDRIPDDAMTAFRRHVFRSGA